jgi:hypothetical protein
VMGVVMISAPGGTLCRFYLTRRALGVTPSP